MICLSCPKGCSLSVDMEAGKVVAVYGNSCPRGEAFARQEAIEPMRVLNCLMRVEGREQVFSVKSSKPLPKRMMEACAGYIYDNPLDASSLPLEVGAVLFENILNTGADIVATMEVK